MESLLYKTYFALDNFLVDKANDVVKAWNWTTGRTRADLADILNASGWIILFSPSIIINHTSAIIGVPVATLNIYVQHERFCRIDENDRRIKNGEALISDPESDIYFLRLTGGVTIATGALVTTISPLYGVGAEILGAAQYVMRADYLPPRKNVLSRAKDKLAEMVSTYRGPITVPIRS